MADKLSLEIQIRTIADKAGLQATTEQLKAVEQSVKASEAAGNTAARSFENVAAKLKEVGAQAATSGEKLKAIQPESIDELAKSFADANTKSEAFGATVAKLTNDQLLQLEEKLRADIKAAQDLGKSTDDLKAKLAETFNTRTGNLDAGFERASKAGKGLAETATNVTRQFGSLKTAAGGLQTAFNGLSQGGIGGLVTAGRGLITTITALASSALGAVLIPILATAGAGFLYLSNQVKKNEEQIKKWAEESKKAAESRKASIAEILAASDAALTKEAAKVDALAKKYAELGEQIDQTRAKVDQLNQARTAVDLAKVDQSAAQDVGALQAAKLAKEARRVGPVDPIAQAAADQRFEQQKAAIEAQAEAKRAAIRQAEETNAVINKKLNAQQDIETGTKAFAEAQAQLDALRTLAETAKQQLEASRQLLQKFTDKGGDLNSIRGRELLQNTAEAEASSKAANQNLGETTKKLEPEIKAADALVQRGNLGKELAELEEQKLKASQAALDAQQKAAFELARQAISEKILADRAELRAARVSGDKEGEKQALADLQVDQQQQALINTQELERRQSVINAARLEAQTRTSAAEKKIAEAKEREAIQAGIAAAKQAEIAANANGDRAGAAAARTAGENFKKQLPAVPGAAIKEAPPVSTITPQGAAPIVVKGPNSVAQATGQTNPKGAILVGPTPQEKAAAAAPAPVLVQPAATVPNAAPVITPSAPTVISTPPPAAATPAPAPDVASVVQPGLDQIASAVTGQPKPEAIKVDGVVAAIQEVGNTTVRVVSENQQATLNVQNALKAAVIRIAALERGLQATREATQS